MESQNCISWIVNKSGGILLSILKISTLIRNRRKNKPVFQISHCLNLKGIKEGKKTKQKKREKKKSKPLSDELIFLHRRVPLKTTVSFQRRKGY